MANIAPSGSVSRSRTVSVTSGRSSHKSSMRSNTVAMNDFPAQQPNTLLRYFEPCAATASMFLYAQGNSIVCCHHDTLKIERRFSMHKDEIQLLAVDNESDVGGGRFVVSYDAGQTAIVWDLMTGDEVARFASFEHLTCASWMKNGNVAFGNAQGNIIQFEPTTSEHIATRTIDQIAITALAPSADCRTFAIGYQNGSLLIATLQPRFTILHNLSTNRGPSPIVTLKWHASSPRQKSDMLAVQTYDGDLRVWSVAKSSSNHEAAKVVRILKRTENYHPGPNWMGWSKNGRIIQFSDLDTLSWDVRTKHVTFDLIPTLDHIRGLAVYGPGATLFTLGASNTVQQFDLNTPAVMVQNIQHPANLLPPSPPVSIEEQLDQGNASSSILSESESMSVPLTSDIVSESDEDRMSPLARLTRHAEPTSDTSDQEMYERPHHKQASTISKPSAGSRTPGPAYSASTVSRARTENTYISAGSSLRSSRAPPASRRERDNSNDTYSVSSLSSISMTSSVSRPSNRRPSRLRNEVNASSPAEDNRVLDLFKFTRSRLSDIPYKLPSRIDNSRLTNDDLRRQMLSTIFGWNGEIDDLVRDEMSRHPNGSAACIMLAKWVGDINSDIMTMSSETMTSSDWMLLALSGIGGQASQHKLGRAYVQRLLENGDVHAASTIMIGMGDHNDAIEIYISHKRYMEALILTCMFFPGTWERQSQIIKKWGEWAVQHGHQQLAIRCFSCTDQESSEPWTSPSANQLSFQSLNSMPEVLSPPLSPPNVNHGPQRSIAKTSALKLITSFGDQPAGQSKFFQLDDGQTPTAAGVTPIAESAVDNMLDPTTAVLRPSNRSAFNTPSSARPRQRLPSIGETGHNLLRTAIEEVDTPENDKAPKLPDAMSRQKHSRTISTQESMPIGISVIRASTASPQMMRETTRREAVNPPPPSPSPQSLDALMQQGRRSRNGPRDRIPRGIDLHLDPLEQEGNPDITSPEQSVTSSARFHWPKRRGPGSVASSVSITSASSTGRSYRQRTVGKSLDDYIHSLDAATQKTRQKSRHNSRERNGRDRSRTRPSSRPGSQDRDRGRSISRGWTPKPNRSPTSPVPMSPEDLISLTTPKAFEPQSGPDDVESQPTTARKSTSVVRHTTSSRASSRTRHRSPDRPMPVLELRGRGNKQDGSVLRSPSSPIPMSATTPHFQGSEDEEDYRRAVEDRERFRARHNNSTSRGLKEAASPMVSRRRDRSQSRTRQPRDSPENGFQRASVSTETRKPRGVSAVRDSRQVKKDAAARELEERRMSLARRPSAPSIPHPETLSPAVYLSPMNFDKFVPPADLPTRSHTVQPGATRGMQASRDTRPTMGLPATPKAMRLKFDSDMSSIPSVPALPQSMGNNMAAQSSPKKKESPRKVPGSGGQNPLTLLPSTVYSPPARNPIPRCMSAPIPDDHPIGNSLSRRKSSKKSSQGDSSMQSINEMMIVPGRRPSYDDQIPPPPPPPPAPQVLRELQHLAIPPPPPPAPLPGMPNDKLMVYGTTKGVIEVVMDDDDQSQQQQQHHHQPIALQQITIPAATPMSEQVVPILSPPAPPSARSDGHRRGRSITDNSLAGRISRATERMRSASRPRTNGSVASRTLSPDFTAPYESIPPPVQFTGPPLPQEHMSERHPRDVKAGHGHQNFRTGLLESEMI